MSDHEHLSDEELDRRLQKAAQDVDACGQEQRRRIVERCPVKAGDVILNRGGEKRLVRLISVSWSHAVLETSSRTKSGAWSKVTRKDDIYGDAPEVVGHEEVPT